MSKTCQTNIPKAYCQEEDCSNYAKEGYDKCNKCLYYIVQERQKKIDLLSEQIKQIDTILSEPIPLYNDYLYYPIHLKQAKYDADIRRRKEYLDDLYLRKIPLITRKQELMELTIKDLMKMVYET